MIDREQYTPGPASEAQVRKGGDKWTLILVRELGHSPEKSLAALRQAFYQGGQLQDHSCGVFFSS